MSDQDKIEKATDEAAPAPGTVEGEQKKDTAVAAGSGDTVVKDAAPVPGSGGTVVKEGEKGTGGGGMKAATDGGAATGKSDTDAGTTTQPARPPVKGANRLGLQLADYKAGESTLCAGCGHDAITAHIIHACHEIGVDQHEVAKLSGIGCSSKTPAYFFSQSHGFNGVHGRMPSIATGVALANHDLKLIGVSGDGDTASIGLGQFCHIVRRNSSVVYIIENNGVYGLTKGQFSATADAGAPSKAGVINELPALDLCALALQCGATFVARSFSGDAKQMRTILKAALSHKGTAIIDVISPCVTFNDHEGSTKSRKYARDSEVPIQGLGFVPFFEQITVEQEEGTVREVTMHDGSKIVLKKLDMDYDPTDKLQAITLLHKAATEKQFLTGLIYIDPSHDNFSELAELVDEPLSHLKESVLRPGREALAEIMAGLK